MGKTISITIPVPLEKQLRETAIIAGMSRSRFIGNILTKWEEDKKTPPNTCKNREEDGHCIAFNIVCKANQIEASTCAGYI